MRTWRGRDPNRDCESEGCEGEDTCIHCDAEMVDLPEDTPPTCDLCDKLRCACTKGATKEKS